MHFILYTWLQWLTWMPLSIKLTAKTLQRSLYRLQVLFFIYYYVSNLGETFWITNNVFNILILCFCLGGGGVSHLVAGTYIGVWTLDLLFKLQTFFFFFFLNDNVYQWKVTSLKKKKYQWRIFIYFTITILVLSVPFFSLIVHCDLYNPSGIWEGTCVYSISLPRCSWLCHIKSAFRVH